MIARIELHAVNPQEDGAADNQGEADDPDVEQDGLYEVVCQSADHRGRQERNQQADDEAPRRGILEHGERDLPDAGKIDRQQCQDGPELDQDSEGLAEILVIETEEALRQEKMAGRGYRQELGQSLDHAEKECLEKLKGHE